MSTRFAIEQRCRRTEFLDEVPEVDDLHKIALDATATSVARCSMNSWAPSLSDASLSLHADGRRTMLRSSGSRSISRA
jgi:hypothetical protein